MRDKRQFSIVKIFNDNYKSEIENKKKQASIDSKSQKEQQELAIKKQAEYKAKYGKILAAKTAYFNVLKKTALKSTSGLGYKIIQNGKANFQFLNLSSSAKLSVELQKGGNLRVWGE